jgi:hypothetical protein
MRELKAVVECGRQNAISTNVIGLFIVVAIVHRNREGECDVF